MEGREWRQKVSQIVEELGGSVDWSGKTHGKAVLNDHQIVVAKTPSDRRALLNFRSWCENVSGRRVKRQKSGKPTYRKARGFKHFARTRMSDNQANIRDRWDEFVELDERMQRAAVAGERDVWREMYRRWVELSDLLHQIGVDTPSDWMVRTEPMKFVRRYEREGL